jgi:UDP-N-acetylmuramate--alanine ligase
MRPVVPTASSESRTESHSIHTSQFKGLRVHFIGIGGCGMAGLASILLDCGATVSGSDPHLNDQTCDLARRGAKVSRSQLGELLSRDIDLVVRTAAVPDSNPEFIAAQKLGLPHMKYADLLGQVMKERLAIAVCGSHGKSTTTAMIAHALLSCGADPSFVVGGTVPQLGGSSRSGRGKAFVVEACEYDRSFHKLFPKVAVITNIDADHLDCYRDIDDIIAAFRKFAQIAQASESGLIIANGTDANVAKALAGLDVPIERVAVRDGASLVACDWITDPAGIVNGCHRGEVSFRGKHVATLALSVPGIHNLYNATAALAACHAAGVDLTRAAAALSRFTGVDRRMTHVGRFNGADVVDDYGHHPAEIAVTLAALRERYSPRRLICVFQPHQHSRTRLLLDGFAKCFTAADLTIIADIYSVRDSDEDKRAITSKTLVDRVVNNGQNALYLPKFEQVTEYLKQNIRGGDLVLTIGAGNVCDIARDLVGPQ